MKKTLVIGEKEFAYWNKLLYGMQRRKKSQREKLYDIIMKTEAKLMRFLKVLVIYALEVFSISRKFPLT